MKIKITTPDETYIKSRNIKNWPVWEKEVSKFAWTYDSEEECLILEGDIIVETADETVHIQPGNFVVFPAGLICVWDIRKPVRKHYNFPQ
jgi:uncharacterized protein